jgi:hypothetical protein
MKILNYFNFILESRGDIKCPAIISKSFIEKLRLIDSPISDYIINMNRSMSHFTFIRDNSDGTIQYSEADKTLKLLEDTYGSIINPQKWLSQISDPEPDNFLWSKNRIDIKIGKFIRRFLPELEISDSEIENFVNKWKALQDTGDKFEYWEGQNIPDAYLTTNYFGEYSYNPLWNSCMNDRTDLVDFYVFTIDLKIVVLINSDGKILGRSLLWKDIEGRLLLDRVYYFKDSDYHRFIDLAKSQNWYYKKTNKSDKWMLGNQERELEIKVKYPKGAIQPGMFPFLDTFRYLSEDGYLSNKEPKTGAFFILNGTDGESEYYSGLRDIYGYLIEESEIDNYITSNTQGGLIYLPDAVHVEYEGFDDWINISYLENPKNGFVFSEEKDQWIKKN